jgi:long-chain fatty acid transport protein
MKKVGLFVVLGVLMLVSVRVSTVCADGFRNPPESASAIGRIGGKIVHSDDASAATVNPANLVDLDAASVMGSASFGYASKTYESPLGVSEHTEDPWAVLPSVFAAWPLAEGKAAAGVGVTVPYGRFTNWDRDVVFGSFSPYYAEQYVLAVNPVIAARIHEKVSVAAGASYYQSTLKFKQIFPWSVLTGDPSTPSGNAVFDGAGDGFGANAAVTWKLNDRHAIALTYRAPFSVDYDGDFDVSNVPAAAAAMGVTAHSDFESTVDYPTVVQAGYGVRIGERLRIEFDVEWVESSRNETLPIDIENNNVLLASTEIAQDWDDNWTYGIGLDWTLNPSWVARAGFIYLETPTQTSTTIPVAAEESQSVVSLGLGYKREGHTFDVAYAVGLFDGVDVSDNVNPGVNGEYDFTSHLVSLAYGRSF